jgi:hypothetical protein
VCLLRREHYGGRRGVVVETHGHCVFSRSMRGIVQDTKVCRTTTRRRGMRLRGHEHWRDRMVVEDGGGSEVNAREDSVNDRRDGRKED